MSMSMPFESLLRDIGLLVLRVGAGGLMMFGHGQSKFETLLNDPGSWQADPIGVGPGVSLVLATGAEFICAGLLVLGLFTRLVSIPLLITMVVAAFVVHGADPLFMGEGRAKEPALLYAIPFLALILTGPGRLSLDGTLWPMFVNWRKKNAENKKKEEKKG